LGASLLDCGCCSGSAERQCRTPPAGRSLQPSQMGSRLGATGSPVKWDCRNTLKPDWEAVVADNGKTYYWNTITDETTWEEPRINQRVMVRPDSPDPGSDSPEGRTFLNWRAEDPLRGRTPTRNPDSRPVSPEPMLEDALGARVDEQGFGGAKAKFARLDNDAREEEAIHARAMRSSSRTLQRVQIRELLRIGCISLGRLVKAGMRCIVPPAQKQYDTYDAHTFHADVHSGCRNAALTVEALQKYQAARDQMAAGKSPEQLSKEMLLASRGSPQGLTMSSSPQAYGGSRWA